MWNWIFRIVALVVGVGIIPTLAGRWVAKRIPWKWYDWLELVVIGGEVSFVVALIGVRFTPLEFAVPFFGLAVFQTTLVYQKGKRRINEIFRGGRQ